MAVRGHVGGDEHPLGQRVGGQVLVEQRARRVRHGQVLDLRQAALPVGDAVVHNGRVVLADVVVAAVLLVPVAHALEARVGHVFLVVRPGDAAVLQQVNDGRDVARRPDKVVVFHAKVVAGNGGHVVGLRRVGDAKVVGQEDALVGKEFKVGYKSIQSVSQFSWG